MGFREYTEVVARGRITTRVYQDFAQSEAGSADARLGRVAGESGQGMVEFALLLPVLLILLAGIISTAITYRNWLTLTDGVRVAGRSAATQLDTLSACASALSAIQASVGPTFWSQVQDYDCIAATVAGDPGVKISAAYPYTITVLFKGILVGQMHSTATERLG